MKTRSVIVFLLIAAIILAGAWSVFGGIPLGAKRFAPMEVLRLGAEMGGETSILLDLQPEEGAKATQEQVDEVLTILQKRMDALGYDHFGIAQLDDDQIEIRLPINETSAFRDAQQLSDMLRQTGRLYITDAANDDALLLDRGAIDKVDVQEDSLGKYTIFMFMNEEGKELLEQITTEVSGREREDDKYIHVFLDDKQVAELSVRQPYTNGYFGYNSSYGEYEADQFRKIINSGMLPVALENNVQIKVSEQYGQGAWQQTLLALAVMTVVSVAALLAVYRFSGILHGLTVIAYAALAVLTEALLGIQITAASLLGTLIALAFLLAAMVCFNENFKKQFATGKNLRAAYRSGYTDATATVTNGFVVLLFGFIALIASGTAALETMAYAYGVCLILAYVCAMVVNRMLFALAVRIWDTKANLYFFVKRANEGGEA